MKKVRLVLFLSAAALVTALALVGASALLRSPGEAAGLFTPVAPATVYAAENAGSGGQINVSGTGSVNVNPDVAYVSLGVNTRGATLKAALAENNRVAAEVIAAVRRMGVADRDIMTAGFNMYPVYNYNYDYSSGKNVEEVVGYTVSNSVSVTIRDVTKVGEVLGAAADAGANVSNGVQFGLLDNSAAYNEALVLAIKNASGKANAIAGALGKSIGSPSSVTESVNYYSGYYTNAVNMAEDGGAGSVPVQAGKLTVTANVQMTYDYPR
jgi:uncharacterized protein YggE